MKREASSHLYVGTYTGSDSQGIYGFRHDPGSNTFAPLGCVAQTSNPSCLYKARRTDTLYTVDETAGPSRVNGSVLSYRPAPRIETLELGRRVGSAGIGPCFLATDSAERHIFVANFHSGSVGCIALRRDGHLGEMSSHIALPRARSNPGEIRPPHPHAIIASPDDKHIVVADLGTDQLLIFGFDSTQGCLSDEAAGSVQFPYGSGPRHMVLHPSRRFLYVIHEKKSMITVHPFGGSTVVSAAIQEIPTVPENGPARADGADIVINTEGTVLYASVRKTSTIRSYRVDATTGRLAVVEDASATGETPQAIGLSPDGRLLLAANIKSSSVDIFTSSGGHLSHTNTLSVPSPSSICFA